MASVNPLSRELVFKIVYYGPGLGGKTTTLEHIHATAKPEHRGKLVSLATPVDRTLYFDFLPVRLPPVRGMNVRLQLFTVPGQVYFNATRKLVLTGADGVVFVSDSQLVRADANLESLENLRDNLADQGRDLAALPIVFSHNKRDFRALTVVDVYTRESLAIEVGQKLKGIDVVRVLQRISQERGAPKVLFCDNGTEFTSQVMDLWAYHREVRIDFSRPGKPTDNAYVESFNGTLRDECLNTHWFTSLEEAKEIIETWRREYNESRPHRALGERTPHEFANQNGASPVLIGLHNCPQLTV